MARQIKIEALVGWKNKQTNNTARSLEWLINKN